MFTDRGEFRDLLAQVPTVRGTRYVDPDTVFEDMSRLSPCLIVLLSRAELRAVYRRFGWRGEPNVRAIQEAAKLYCNRRRRRVNASRARAA